MICGTGVDIVEIDRIAGVWERHGPRFLRRVFTPGERAYALRRGHPIPHLAGRFAAKEAVMKALGTGWARGVAWRQIEVRRAPGQAPTIRLTGAAARRAKALGGSRWHLSISHARSHAVACVILEGAGGAAVPVVRPRRPRKKSRR